MYGINRFCISSRCCDYIFSFMNLLFPVIILYPPCFIFSPLFIPIFLYNSSGYKHLADKGDTMKCECETKAETHLFVVIL